MEPSFSSNHVYAGEFRHALDPKNRITIPARWRRAEVEDFYIVPEQHGRFLIVMPFDEFQNVGKKITDNPQIPEEKKRKFFRKFYSQASQVSVDRQGRMLLPEEYCRRVDLGPEVMLAGGLSRFEIWNPDRWKAVMQDEENDYCEVADMTGL